MQIHVHTDNNIAGSTELTAHVELEVLAVLSRFSDRVTRVEVHLSDESAGRPTGADIRCLVETRPSGRAPVIATVDGESVDRALTGAVRAMSRLLDTTEAELDGPGGRASIRGRSVT